MTDWELGITAGVAAHMRQVEQRAVWAEDPVKWAKDVLGVHLWSKQAEIARSVVENKKTVVASCHGTGKALEPSTPLPLPGGGFKAIGDVVVGDVVCGADGMPVTVTAVTGVHVADRWRLTFVSPAGTAQIVASGDHVWPVLDSQEQARISVECERRGIGGHDFSAWQHRAKNVNTRELIRMMRAGQMPLVPGEDTFPGRVRPVDFSSAPVVGEMASQRGVCDRTGMWSLLWMTTPSSVVAPDPHDEVRRSLTAAGIRTIASCKRDTTAKYWTLSAMGDPRLLPLLPSPDDRALSRMRFLAQTGRKTGPDHGGWRLAEVMQLDEGDMCCIQVDAPDRLYLAGIKRIPTHNSMIASVLTCWWVSTRPRDDVIAVSTAPTYAQVNKIIWEEIRKHHATARNRGKPLPGRVTQSDEWKDDDGRVLGFGRKPMSGDRHGFQGIHREFVFAVIDESCGVPEEVWTGVEAITTTDQCRILAIGNPDDRNTEFGRVFLRPELAGDWNRIKVPASSTPNFTGEKVPSLLRRVLVSPQWCEERRRDWGEKDARYIAKVTAEFPATSQSSLIGPHLIENAFEDVPAQERRNVLRIGVDVARFGPDSTIVVSYAGRTARVEDAWHGTDTTSSAYRVLRIAEECRERLDAAWTEIRVDAVGLGAGVVDTLNARSVLLKEPWFTVYEMHGSAAPPADLGGSVHGYGNARAYWYDQLRQNLGNQTVKIEEGTGSQIIKDDLAIVYYVMKNGRMFIISKEEMRTKHGRSPDYSDALVYATAPVFGGMAIGSTLSEDAADLAEEPEDAQDFRRDLSISPF